MITFEKAVEIAARLHAGQKDLDGKPVLLHPLSVALMGKTEEEQIAGVLHDVIEDTSCSLHELETLGVDAEVIAVLKLLTHEKRQSYEEYLSKIIESRNIIALKVKKNDLCNNISRNNEDTDKKKRIKAKHLKALMRIEKALEICNL